MNNWGYKYIDLPKMARCNNDKHKQEKEKYAS